MFYYQQKACFFSPTLSHTDTYPKPTHAYNSHTQTYLSALPHDCIKNSFASEKLFLTFLSIDVVISQFLRQVNLRVLTLGTFALYCAQTQLSNPLPHWPALTLHFNQAKNLQKENGDKNALAQHNVVHRNVNFVVYYYFVSRLGHGDIWSSNMHKGQFTPHRQTPTNTYKQVGSSWLMDLEFYEK